jgi:hypothetical protein
VVLNSYPTIFLCFRETSFFSVFADSDVVFRLRHGVIAQYLKHCPVTKQKLDRNETTVFHRQPQTVTKYVQFSFFSSSDYLVTLDDAILVRFPAVVNGGASENCVGEEIHSATQF